MVRDPCALNLEIEIMVESKLAHVSRCTSLTTYEYIQVRQEDNSRLRADFGEILVTSEKKNLSSRDEIIEPDTYRVQK